MRSTSRFKFLAILLAAALFAAACGSDYDTSETGSEGDGDSEEAASGDATDITLTLQWVTQAPVRRLLRRPRSGVLRG